MKLVVLGAQEVEELLPFPALIPALETALVALSSGRALCPPRLVLPAGAGALGIMPAVSQELRLLGAKIVGVFPSNRQRGLNPHQGAVILQDPVTGTPEAVLDGSAITARRTAALVAAATRALAREDALCLALFGTGLQAELQAEAIYHVRPLKEIHLYGRNKAHAESLATRLESKLPVRLRLANSPRDALRRADLACLCTASDAPYLHVKDLPPGMHVNASGACRPGMAEIRCENRQGLEIFVDHFFAVEREAEEIYGPLREGRLSSSSLKAEIGQVFAQLGFGRSSSASVTLFKSVGVGILDLAAARFALDRYRRKDAQHDSPHSA